MFEMLISPRHAEKKPYGLFFIGLLYVALSLLMVNIIFSRDPVLSKHSSILAITFTVIFSMPFIHSLIRMEEIREIVDGQNKILFKPHFRAIVSLLFLFLGFLAAFTIAYLIMPKDLVLNNFSSQIEQFCRINYPSVEACLKDYGISPITGNAISLESEFMSILINNIYVLIFTLVFSLTFGAGAIFILAWNASVIAAAIGLFVKGSVFNVPFGLLAYLTHGIPEIIAYLIAALGGGILSTAIIRKDFSGGKLMNILIDFLVFMIIALVILVAAALLEVYVTPLFFA
ncbi:MAG: stage II sporulation protein M [archaeon]